MEPTKVIPKAEVQRTGLVPAVATIAIDVVDKSQSTTLGIVQDARAELRVVADSAIEVTEKLVLSMFRFARKLTARIDDAVNDTVATADRQLAGVMRSARETTRAAGDLAVTAFGGIADPRATA